MNKWPRRWRLIWCLAGSGLGFVGSPLWGQALGPDPEFLGFDRPEAWAMKRFIAVAQPDGLGPKSELGPGKWVVEGELSEVPFLSKEERRVGFRGEKFEDLNKAEVVARLIGRVGLPTGFSLEFSYVPPVDVYDVEAQIGSISLSRRIARWGGSNFHASAYFVYGEAKGAFTCSHELVEAGEDPFRCVPPSKDRNLWRSGAVELVASHPLEAFNLVPFLSSTYQYADSGFQTDVLVSGGDIRDQRTLKAEGYFWTFSAGAQIQLTDALMATLAFRYAPLDISLDEQGPPERRSLNQFRSRISYRF